MPLESGVRTPKNKKTNTRYLKGELPPEPLPLGHIRRLADEKKENGETFLRLMVCTTKAIPEEERVRGIVQRALGVEHDVPVEIRQIAKYAPYTKEQATEWAAKSWPIMWRGNPTLIKTPLSQTEVDTIVRRLRDVVALAGQRAAGDLPCATIIVDPERDTVVAQHCDDRVSSGNPLHHSVMEAVHDAARAERNRRKALATAGERATPASATATPGLSDSPSPSVSTSTDESQNYLCLNMHVYTTHEPCTMCAMALVHSRIGRLVYIQSSPQSGAIEPTSGAGFGVHWSKQLNWRYEAWKWIGSSDELGSLEVFPADHNP